MHAHKGWSALVAGAAALAVAAVAWAGATLNATTGTIGTNVAFSAFGFDPGTKAPKVALVPQAGGRNVPMKVLAFSAARIDAQVVKGLAGDYGVLITPADRAVPPVTVDGTFTIVLPAPTAVEPASGPVNVPLVILGDSFGTSRGKVTVGGKKAKVTSWANDRIETVVPKKLAAGAQPVVVVGKAGASTAAVSYTVAGGGGGTGGEYLRCDLPVVGHFEVTQREPIFFSAMHNVSQDFIGVSGAKKPTGVPSFGFTINAPELATPMPYDLTTSPPTVGAPYVSAICSDGAGNVYQASQLTNFRVTVTGYADGVLSGTFSGDLGKLVGPGAATMTVSNGEFRVLLEIVGQ